MDILQVKKLYGKISPLEAVPQSQSKKIIFGEKYVEIHSAYVNITILIRLSTLWLFLSLPVTRVMHLTSQFSLQIVRSTTAWNSSKYCSKESWNECFYFPRHDTWAYTGKRGNRFTHSAGDGREWLVHAPATLPSWKGSGTQWIGGWVDHRTGTEFGRWAQGRKYMSKVIFRRFRETIISWEKQ